jgi:hypothetical protein
MNAGRWVVERSVWKPRKRVWAVRYYQHRSGPVGFLFEVTEAWYTDVTRATKLTEADARRIAAARLQHARAVPLSIVRAREQPQGRP